MTISTVVQGPWVAPEVSPGHDVPGCGDEGGHFPCFGHSPDSCALGHGGRGNRGGLGPWGVLDNICPVPYPGRTLDLDDHTSNPVLDHDPCRGESRNGGSGRGHRHDGSSPWGP